MSTPTHKTIALLEQDLKIHFPNETTWSVFLERLVTGSWEECSSLLHSYIPDLAEGLLDKAKRLFFICKSRFATCDLACYEYAPKASQEFTDNFWTDIPSVTIDVLDRQSYQYTLCLDTSPCYTVIGNVKVPAYSLQTNFRSPTIWIIPQLWPAVFVQVPRCFKSQEHTMCQFTLHAPGCIKSVKTIQITQSSSEVIDSVLRINNFYSSLTKVLNLYLYYCSRPDAHREVASLYAASKNTASSTSSRNPTCFRFHDAAHLVDKHPHSSPKEHIRQAHVRHYANGKKVVVSSCIVNKGNTNFFSSQPLDTQK